MKVKKMKVFLTADGKPVVRGMVVWQAHTRDGGETFSLVPHTVTKVHAFGMQLDGNTAWCELTTDVRTWADPSKAAAWVLGTKTLAVLRVRGTLTGRELNRQLEKYERVKKRKRRRVRELPRGKR